MSFAVPSLCAKTPFGICPVVGIFQPQEIVRAAAQVRVIAIGEQQKGPLRGLGMFIAELAAKPVDRVPMQCLFSLLVA
ncbi:MAG: hypothetical protein P4L84_06860 [Isosphaeraceae bacterium]|nr:hypothetical protein [Isosphaeraceae bacterium]